MNPIGQKHTYPHAVASYKGVLKTNMFLLFLAKSNPLTEKRQNLAEMGFANSRIHVFMPIVVKIDEG